MPVSTLQSDHDAEREGCSVSAQRVAELEELVATLRRDAEEARLERDDAVTWAAEHGRPFPGALSDGVNDVLGRVRAALNVPKGANVVAAAVAARAESSALREALGRYQGWAETVLISTTPGEVDITHRRELLTLTRAARAALSAAGEADGVNRE